MSDYAFEGPKWSSSTITWSFAPAGGDYTNAITGAYQNIVRAAIARWAQVANVTFKEVPDSTNVAIRVGWASFSGTELGETDFSYLNNISSTQIFRPGTTVRLEDPAIRPVGAGLSDYYQGTATTLFQTVLHEIGHALGLAHSTNPADIMYPTLGPNDTNLGAADIQGVQILYGAPAGGAMIASMVIALISPSAVNAASGVIAVYRFFDSTNGTQFLTASAAEQNSVIATRLDLTYEGLGLGGIAPGADASAVPVFRFFDTTTGTHFFTSSQSEQNNLVATRPDLVLEQTTFYEHATAQAGDNPVYRFFDKTDGTHFYTVSATERSTIAATRPDMAFEGIAFYAPVAMST